MSSTGKPGNAVSRAGARQVGDLVGSVLEETVARRTGMTIDLIAAWEDIAGPEYAPFTRPERIQWPRQASDAEAFEPGTLVIACDGARSVFLQHQSGEFISRLNQFFGFEAIARIRIVQKPVHAPQLSRRAPPELGPDERERLEGIVGKVGNEELRTRLRRLGEGVLGRRRR